MNDGIHSFDPNRAERRLLVGNRWAKANVYLLRDDDREAVLKDYRAKSVLVRWIGALQLAREARAYRRLAGLSGIPRLLDRPGPHCLLLEFVESRRLSACRGPEYDLESLLGELEAVVERIHERGVSHNDLRARENIRVSAADGRLFLIDFSGASFFPPGSLRRRFFSRLLRFTDESALLKWKAELLPEQLTAAERQRLGRHRLLRRLWPFNRKCPRVS